MEILVYLVVGLVVGAVARLLMPGRDPIGLLATIALGVIGAVVGGYLWAAVFGDTPGVNWIGSVLVAMGLLWLYRKMTYDRKGSAL